MKHKIRPANLESPKNLRSQFFPSKKKTEDFGEKLNIRLSKAGRQGVWFLL